MGEAIRPYHYFLCLWRKSLTGQWLPSRTHSRRDRPRRGWRGCRIPAARPLRDFLICSRSGILASAERAGKKNLTCKIPHRLLSPVMAHLPSPPQPAVDLTDKILRTFRNSEMAGMPFCCVQETPTAPSTPLFLKIGIDRVTLSGYIRLDVPAESAAGRTCAYTLPM